MKFAFFPAALVLAAALASAASVSALAPTSAEAKTYAKKASQPLRGTIYGGRRVGGYSYKYSDTLSPGSRTSPAVTGLYPDTGALDGDFFFNTARAPFGGYTPYMH